MKLGTTKIQNESGMIKVYNFVFIISKLVRNLTLQARQTASSYLLKYLSPDPLLLYAFTADLLGSLVLYVGYKTRHELD